VWGYNHGGLQRMVAGGEIGTAAKLELRNLRVLVILPDHPIGWCPAHAMLVRSENTTVLLRHMDSGSGSGSSFVGCGARLYATTYSLHACNEVAR
jgi:hypothetical protein